MGQSLRRWMISMGLAEEDQVSEQARLQAQDREQRAAREQEDADVVPVRSARSAESRGSESGGATRAEPVRPAPRVREHRREPEYRAPVTPIKRAGSGPREDSEDMRTITTVHPRSYNDARSVGQAFRDGTPVIMDLSDLGEAEAKRLVDFAAGLVYALHGSIERVTPAVFLLTPSYVDVVDSTADAAEDDESSEV